MKACSTHTETETNTYRQTDKKYTNLLLCRQIDWKMDRLTYKQTDTDNQKDSQTDICNQKADRVLIVLLK